MSAHGAVRLGLRYVRGLRRDSAAAIEQARREHPFRNLDDLVSRGGLQASEIDQLAYAGALTSFDAGRRDALWQAARAARPAGPLLADLDRENRPQRSPLPKMSAVEETAADYRATGLTTGPHPFAYSRRALRRHRVATTAELLRGRAGARVRFGGAVVVRQRPGTAKGVLFVTLEDETGMAQALVTPDLFERYRKVIVGATGLVIEGILERRDGSVTVKAERFWPVEQLVAAPSHDFH